MSKQPTHTVTHKRLYLRVDNALQRVPVGTSLTLSDKQAEALGSRVAPINTDESIDMTEATEDDLEALRAKAKDLNIAVNARWGAKKLQTEIEKAEAAIAAASNAVNGE